MEPLFMNICTLYQLFDLFRLKDKAEDYGHKT